MVPFSCMGFLQVRVIVHDSHGSPVRDGASRAMHFPQSWQGKKISFFF